MKPPNPSLSSPSSHDIEKRTGLLLELRLSYAATELGTQASRFSTRSPGDRSVRCLLMHRRTRPLFINFTNILINLPTDGRLGKLPGIAEPWTHRRISIRPSGLAKLAASEKLAPAPRSSPGFLRLLNRQRFARPIAQLDADHATQPSPLSPLFGVPITLNNSDAHRALGGSTTHT
jgi:hypothetical protein